MKNLIKIIFILFSSNLIVAQVGIGTTTPHSSSILDVNSSEKGILLPTLSTMQRDAIPSPANGLLIFNSTTTSYNYYDMEWRDFSPNYKSVHFTDEIFTTSNADVNIPGMILSPPEGVYSVSFNSQINCNDILSPLLINSGMLLADFDSLYNQLQAYPTGSTHAAAFGNGEVLFPGKYYIAEAISVSDTIVLNGMGNPNSIFIIHSGGAVNFAAATTVVLINGATEENIFWLGEGVVGVGANSTVFGNLISHGAAVAVGADCTVVGRLLTNAGALSCGPGTCRVPENTSTVVNIGNLETFVLFTGNGAINNTGNTIYTGNICSRIGALTSLSSATVNGVIIAQNGDTNINNDALQSYVASFGIYQNDVLIPNSTRFITCNPGYSNITLTTLAVVQSGEMITMKWKVDSGKVTIGNRIMTLIKVH